MVNGLTEHLAHGESCRQKAKQVAACTTIGSLAVPSLDGALGICKHDNAYVALR